MATYKIIGADQKEYGPVSGDQVRAWITEGRVNGQTSVWTDGATEWKPLAAFPEFADNLRATPSAAPAAAAGGTAVVPVEVVLGRDYSLDIGNCITRSWELVKQHLGPMVGITFLVMVVIGVVNQLIGLLSRPALMGIITEHRVSIGGIAIIFVTSFLVRRSMSCSSRACSNTT